MIIMNSSLTKQNKCYIQMPSSIIGNANAYR